MLRFDPPATIRSRGANQLGRITFRQRLSPDDSQTYHLIVRSTNRWDSPDALQQYAVAVSLWRDRERAPFYAELQARVEIPVELEVRP